MSFKIGEAFIEVGAQLNEKAVDGVVNSINEKVSGMLNDEMEKITNFGHTTATKTAMAAQVGFAAMGVGLAGSVDTSLREVNTLFGETGAAGDKNLAWIRDGAYQLSSELGITQRDIVPGLYQAISAGVPRDNVFSFMETASQLAIGGVATTEESVDLLSTALNAFGIPASEAERVADGLFQTVADGKTTIPELAASLFNVAPIASAAGVSIEETNAAIATMTSRGTPTAQATTQIRAAIQSLLSPTENLTALYQANGYESGQAAIEALGLQGALDLVADAAGGDVGAMQSYMGTIEGVQGALAISGEGADKYTESLENQTNSAGNTVRAFEQMEGGIGGAGRTLKTTMENFAIVIGEALLPSVQLLTSAIQGVLNIFMGLPKPVQQALAAMLFLLTAIVPPLIMFYKYWRLYQLLRTLNTLAGAKAGLMAMVGATQSAAKSTLAFKAAATLKKGFMILTHPIASLKAFAIAATASAKKFMAAAIIKGKAWLIAFGPIGLVIAAVAGLAYLIYKYWDEISAFLQTSWEWIKVTAETIWNSITEFFSGAWDAISLKVTEVWTAITGWLSETWNSIVETATTIWATITTFFSDMWAKVVEIFTGIYTSIITIFGPIFLWFWELWTEIYNFFSSILADIWHILSNTFINIVALIVEKITEAWQWLVGKWTEIYNFYVDVLTRIWNKVREYFTNIYNTVREWITTAWNFIREQWTRVFNFYADILSKIWNKVREIFTKVYNTVKEWVLKVYNYIKERWDAVLRYLAGLVAKITAAVIKFIKPMYDKVKEWIDKAKKYIEDQWNNIISFFGRIKGRISSATSGMWDGIKDAFRAAINWVIDKWNGLSFGLPRIQLPELMGGGSVGGQSFRPPRIPRLAKGGDILGSGVAMVGEEGPEYLRLPRGAQVRPLDKGPGGSSFGTVNINISGTWDLSNPVQRNKIAQEMKEAISDLERSYY